MAVVYDNTTKNGRMQVVKDNLEAGSGAPILRIRTAGGATLVDFELDDPIDLSGDTLDFAASPIEAQAEADGTANNAQLLDSDANVIVSGLTVGTSGANVIIDNTAIANGQTCRLNAATLQHG